MTLYVVNNSSIAVGNMFVEYLYMCSPNINIIQICKKRFSINKIILICYYSNKFPL